VKVSLVPESIEALCARLASPKHWPFGRGWYGDITDIRLRQRPLAMTKKLGYEPPYDFKFHEVSLQTASGVLAYLCREGLAYGRRQYRQRDAKEFERMLIAELGPYAQFWTSCDASHIVEEGQEVPSTGMSWTPLSDKTFEFGVIGYNQTKGFVFWVECED
jgi:hypothetical protein